MKKFRSLNFLFIVFVLAIFIDTGISSGLLTLLIYKLNLLKNINMAPVVMIFIMGFLFIIIGPVIFYLVGKSFLKPLNDLIAATKEVERGNYNVKVTSYKKDNELGDLIKNFNNMSHELSSVEIMHRDFINNFSHEFKTPIVSIHGFAKQLQNPSLTREKQIEYSDIIIKESERLTNLSSSILLLSRLENQDIISSKVSFSLDEQLRKCILLLQKNWEDKNLDLNLTLNPVTYYGNEEMLTGVWLNIIGNAIKYSPKDGELIVECNKIDNYVKVKIKDSGIGMTDEMIKHIFDKFYQGDKSHKTHGNGLGLPIAKRIIDLYGGTIFVESKPQGGTTFTVLLNY